MLNKPTAFDELRYGYFDVAFGNLLKAIRGGVTPPGVMTLAMCSIGTLSDIEWCIKNDSALQVTGELPGKRDREALNYRDKIMYEGWMKRWFLDSGININCNPAKVYGVRCALVHTAGASEALSNTGVKAWQISAYQPQDHYQDVMTPGGLRFNLNMPDFISELLLGADKFLSDNKTILENASEPLRKRIGFIALPLSGNQSTRLVRNKESLLWFDPRLSKSPLEISKENLSEKIKDTYKATEDLVLQ